MIKLPPLIILFLGAPGSGKGTQAKLLQKKTDFLYFSTGDYTRREIASGSQLGKEMTKYLASGQLLPELMMKEAIDKYLETHQQAIQQRGLIFDGYPRRLGDAQNLAGRVIELHLPQFLAIYLRLSDQSAVQRILSRKDSRLDDTEEIVRKRLAAFGRETAPLIIFYRQQSRLLEIDGQPSIEKIHQDIIKTLSEWVKST